MSWRLADLGRIYDGPHATPTRQEKGPYFLNIASLTNGRLDLQQSDHVSEDDFVKWTRRVMPQEGDLLFSYETRLGEAALMPPGVKACLGRRMALIRPNLNRIDPRFLLYLYLSPSFRQLIDRHTIHGATVNRIGLSTMGSWSVDMPGLAEQRAIAEVLGALDDKIAANAKLVESADQLAHARFLSTARGAELSDLTFCDVSSVRGGGTPRTSIPEYWDGNINWATPTDVTGLDGLYLEGTLRRITQAGLDACASGLYPAGSILMTSRATIGAFAIAQRLTAVNQGFIVVNPHDDRLKWWLFHEMRSRVDEFVSLANGATFLELSRGNFKQFRVRLTDESVMTDFGVMAEGLHSMARERLLESSLLADLRDVLLPQLMSGNIRVKDVEKTVGEVL